MLIINLVLKTLFNLYSRSNAMFSPFQTNVDFIFHINVLECQNKYLILIITYTMIWVCLNSASKCLQEKAWISIAEN